MIEDLKKVKLVDNYNIIGTSINYEPYVYPVQFFEYKNETFYIKSFIENFNNLFSIELVGNLIMRIARFYFTNRLI